MEGLALLGLGVPLVFFGLLVLVILTVANRDEPDPDGLRPRALYLASVSFVTLFAALFALFAVVVALVGLALDDDENGDFAAPIAIGTVEASLVAQGFDDRDADDRRVSEAVGAGLAAVAAGGAYRFHSRRLQVLVREYDLAPGPVRRVWQTYLHVVCFVAMGTTIVAGVIAAYGLFQMAAPGVTGVEGRKQGASQALSAGLLAVAAYLLFLLHWRKAGRRGGPAFESSVVLPPAAPVPAPTPVDLEEAPRRRRPLRATPQPPDDPRGPAPG